MYHLDSVLQVLVGEKNLSDSALSWPKRAGCAEQIWTDLQRHPLYPAGHLNWSRFRKEMVDWKVHQPTMEDTNATNSEWKEGYFFCFVFFFRGRFCFFWFLVLCFAASLIFCFFAFPAFCVSCFSAFHASLLLCFTFSFLLLCFPCFPASLLLCFCAFLLLLFYFFFSSVMRFCCSTSCSSASLLPVFTASLFFSFLLLYSLLFVSLNEILKTLGETQRNPNEILTRTTDKKPLNETLNEP